MDCKFYNQWKNLTCRLEGTFSYIPEVSAMSISRQSEACDNIRPLIPGLHAQA